jgi:hypothetical protein
MPAVVPSFIAKLSRAKKHLVDLEAEIQRFADTHPYTVCERVEGKKKRKIRRLTFTADPANTDIPIIAADAIYNLRSSLDHLMSSLVARRDRGSAMFPIFFQGVWESPLPGEDEQRSKERARWASDVKTLPNDAITILKSLQPPDRAWQDDEEERLRVINRLSNRDRHEKLPVIAAGLTRLEVTYRQPDGTVCEGIGEPGPPLKNHAELEDIPHDAVDVQIQGVPVVGIQIGDPKEGRYVEIPRGLHMAADFIARRVFTGLTPFVRADAA